MRTAATPNLMAERCKRINSERTPRPGHTCTWGSFLTTSTGRGFDTTGASKLEEGAPGGVGGAPGGTSATGGGAGAADTATALLLPADAGVAGGAGGGYCTACAVSTETAGTGITLAS